MAIEYIDRPPRIQPELPVDEIEIPQPPDLSRSGQQALVTQIIPLITIIGFVLVSGSGNALFILPLGLVMFLSIGFALTTSRRERKENERKQRAYELRLAELRQEMERSHNAQRLFYRHNYPDVQTLYEVAERKETSRFGGRLWERRTSDSDFGAIRLGMGARPSTVVYRLSQMGGAGDENPLAKDAQKLADDSLIVDRVPITIPLRPFTPPQEDHSTDEVEVPHARAIEARHSIGIVGQNPINTSDFARATLAHFAAFHSPDDARLYVVGQPHSQSSWQWAEWLPHCNVREIGIDEPSGEMQSLDQLCFSADKNDVAGFWTRIKRELDQRSLRMQETDDEQHSGDMSLPLLLVVVDLLGEVPEDSPLAEVAAENAVATINQEGPQLGAAIIFLADDPAKIPSECGSMIEVASVGKKVVFRYAETGVNSTRYLGDADLANAADARQLLASRIRRLAVRRPFGTDLPSLVDILQMQSRLEERRIDTVDKLAIEANWKRSILPENSEWLSAPIGMTSMRDIRQLVVSAKEGGDGVHGMIAGTTGSGKSELLLTLIASLAAKYDPRIVNFVLVDFKGGAAFEPFRRLPHCVDILTNLEENAVERMFVAIQAVMDERSRILAKSGAKDLVEYRRRVIPRLSEDDPLPKTFPHLFIIVDEFAEMIAANPDYRNQFESITRLGRAFGVTLILSTQRPAGVVTDQMRANMKFRMCLRVETPEDSKELLDRPDAAFLPNMGGRGYIQVGNDILVPLQVARVAGDYSDDRTVVLRDVIWLDEQPEYGRKQPEYGRKQEAPDQAQDADAPLYSELEIAEALGLEAGDSPTSMLDWIVGITAIRAQRDGVPVQRKPWPDPLPANLSLTESVDARYLNTERSISADKTIVINQRLQDWLKNEKEKPIWPEMDWKSPSPLRASIGLIDNPHRAEQRILDLDLNDGPVVLFGAAGRGKTSFVKTLLTGLAATRTPKELHMYALDFGRGGLKGIQDLPHLGALIDVSEVARVDQLVRMLRNFVNERQELLAKFNSLADYNRLNPDNPFAEIVVVIDNFAEFQESYEHQSAELMTLIRDGRAFGIHFVITAGSSNELGSKLFNLLTQRLTLTQADSMAHADVIGVRAPGFDNLPGRGLMALEAEDERVPVEFHVGIPGRTQALLDSDEVDGYQAIAQRMERVWTALGGERPAAELPKSFDLLEMYAVRDGREYQRIGELPIAENWVASMQPENQEWLRAPLGLVSSREVREMVFSAKADGDGVHGMVAGTTGSGKSELLLTLIASMAIEYDPRIVNFVLVDFKGGAAFEPFKKLPHVVDIATNLQGNAVERIFIAIKAELDRRAKLLADGRVGDLVDYRKKVIPKLKKGDPLPDTFPHLFIIVDEFAEMIMANPEYKAQFESITRLGRAFGATLILATQRPAGMVTDQMRANMKFRICLRVETAEDSKELLKRPDAATLPPLGGRGYIQVGGGPLTELQAAWAGGDYSDDGQDPVYKTKEMLDGLELTEDNAPGLLIDWLVGALAAEARKQKVPKQFKPWPDPLPSVLSMTEPIDASYLEGAKPGEEVLIDPKLARWLSYSSAKSPWPEVDWSQPIPMVASVGIVDNPYQARQTMFNLDLASDPLVVFGAAGRGKTTFLKSLILSLAASLSPADLQIQILDFGRGGLKSLRHLPHVGGVVDANEDERVERLLRMVRHTIDERQRVLQAYDSLVEYNQAHPDQAFPALLIVVDNVAEFKETYEEHLNDLIDLVRDGRSFGVYFAFTANLVGDVPSRLFNVLGQRVTFTQVDPTDYSTIVGRGWVNINDEPGRGLMVATVDGRPYPLEFHAAVPAGDAEGETTRDLVQRMAKGWEIVVEENPKLADRRARPVEVLPEIIELPNVLPALGKGQAELAVPIGVNDLDRETTLVELAAKGPHWLVIGPPMTGKTTTLRSFVLSLAHCYSPSQVGMILVDPSDPARRFFNFGAGDGNTLDELPHVLATVTNAEELDRVVKRLYAEYDDKVRELLGNRTNGFKPQDNKKRSIFVIMDHYDDVDLLNSTGMGTYGLSEVGKGHNLHFVIGGSLDIMRDSSDKLRRRAESARYTLVLQDFEHVRYMGVRGDLAVNKELPPGRGFMVKAISASLVQVCMPYLDGAGTEHDLGKFIANIKSKHSGKALWSYQSEDLNPLEAAMGAEASLANPMEVESGMMSDLSDLMAMQADMADAFTSTEIPEGSNFATVEVESDGGSKGKSKGKSKSKPKSKSKSKRKSKK